MKNTSFPGRTTFKPVVHEEHGSALVLVLVILTTLTILCTVVLKGVYVHTRSVARAEQAIQAFYLAEAAIEKTLWLLSGHEGKDATWRPVQELINVFDDQEAFVTVTDWGGYLRIDADATWHHRRERITVLAGIEQPSEYARAVILGETGYPLIVTGENKIVGDVLVGLKGVETGMIAGQGFQGTRPVEGKIERAAHPAMPFFDPSQFERSFQHMQSPSTSADSLELLYADVTIDSSFMKEIQSNILTVEGDALLLSEGPDPLFPDYFLLDCAGSIRIRGSGNLGYGVQLSCQDTLSIQEAPSAVNGIFHAEKAIKITGAGYLSGQFFSSRQIVIRGEAQLTYPSVLYCSGSTADNRHTGRIQILDQSRIDGTVILSPFQELQHRVDDETQIEIGPGTVVRGIVYASHSTMLEGTVHGCSVTETYSLYVSPTTYINWLRDATIDRSKLSNSYYPPVGFGKVSRFRIVEWEDFQTYRVDQISSSQDGEVRG